MTRHGQRPDTRPPDPPDPPDPVLLVDHWPANLLTLEAALTARA